MMNSDDKLDLLLREWRCGYGADPWLEDRVWLRINREEISEEKVSFLERFSWLQSPAFASALLVLALAGGVGLAELQVRQAEQAGDEQLAEEYFQSINPVALASRGGER